MNTVYTGFDASSWCCLSRGDDEEGGDYETNDEALNDDTATNEVRRKFVAICFASQRKVLGQICGENISSHRNRRQLDDDDDDDDDRRALRLELATDLFMEEKQLYLVRDPRTLWRSGWSRDVEYYDRAFDLDLIGCLRRRHKIETGRRVRADDDLEMLPPPSFIHHVRIGSRFLCRFCRGDLLHKANLEKMLLGLLADSGLQILHLYKDAAASYFEPRDLRPFVDGAHRLKAIRLELLGFANADEVNDFANFFASNSMILASASPPTAAGYERWANLRSLEIRGLFTTDGTILRLDPIFRAISGMDDEGAQGRNHLPSLETFRLDVESERCCHLDDDAAFVRFLDNRTTIKHLALTGFVNARHCRLIERHLSTHPNIETLELCALDFLWDRRVHDLDDALIRLTFRDEDPNDLARAPEEESAFFDAMGSLVRLAIANQDLKKVTVGHAYLRSLDQLFLPYVRELASRTALNRKGLKYFQRGIGESSGQWSKRECVEFMIRLHNLDGGGDEVWDSFAHSSPAGIAPLARLDALYLSLRMRPDLCLSSHTET